MRAALALALVTACGHEAKPEQCSQRADAIEARIRAQEAELAQLQAIHAIVGDDAKGLPLEDEGSADFAAGVVLPIAKPDVLEAVANAEACSAQKTKQPVHVYAVSASEEAVGESAAWLRKAGKTWGISFDLRWLVHLPREHDVFPWPPHSEKAQALAKRAFAKKSEPDLAAIGPAVTRAMGRCDAIQTSQTVAMEDDRAPIELDLALPRGLRTCNCNVPDLDELEGIWHAMFYARTEIGWAPPLEDAKTSRSVAPLACEGAAEPLIVSSNGSWSTESADLRPVLMGVLDQVTQCRDKLQLDHSAVVAVTLQPDATESTTIIAEVGSRPVAGLQQCVHDLSPRFPVAQPSEGSEVVLIYLPPAKLTTAP